MEHSPPENTVSEAFARRFRAAAEAGAVETGEAPTMSFARFMELALYDEEVGYYRGKRLRIGRTPGADFYTASNLRTVFGPLVAAAASTLLAPGGAKDFTFVEIGAEPGQGVLGGISHGFRDVRTIRVGERFDLRGDLVVFSNELFDAQPFHRVVFRAGDWREAGVRLDDGGLAWVDLSTLSKEAAGIRDQLPSPAPEGHTVDVPLAAERLARKIADEPWHGLFLAFDYGRGWTQLSTEFPEGTGRAYAGHRQSGDLLAHPGRQDLTCHVCWDWIEAALRGTGFAPVTRESQEAFFLRRATAAVEAVLTGDPNPLSPSRTQLKQLLHPALLGQRFEALWAVRRHRPNSPDQPNAMAKQRSL